MATEGARRRGSRAGTAASALAATWALLLLTTACVGTGDDDAEADPTDSAAPAERDEGTAAITREQVDGSLDELDAIVEAAMAETGVPGVAVAVVFDDEVIHERGYGVRNTETGEPVSPETVFQVASLSKPISSTVIAGAVGNGVVAWDDPLSEHSTRDVLLSDPWVSDHVTFEDLFAHRSGLPGAAAGNDLESVGFDRDTILDRLRYVPLDPFRTTYSYSNFGMTLGGEVVAEAAGTTWEDLAADVLFGPAGMTSSSMRHVDYVAHDDRAALHVPTDDGWLPAFERQPDAQAPAGGVSANVVDLARWLRLQLGEGALDGEQVIDADALARTHVPMIVTAPPDPPNGGQSRFYGLGWIIETDPTGAVRWNHSGAFSTGAATTAKLLPADGLGIVVLTNGAPIGIPEAITDAYFELLQQGEVTTDWLEVWAERFAGIYGEPLDVAAPADPTPARDPSAYTGTYANDYVGEVQVVDDPDGDGLELLIGPAPESFALAHVDGDLFAYVHDPELPDHLATAAFTVDDGGVAVSVTLSALDGAGLGTLARA